jgi:hypothetical protein
MDYGVILTAVLVPQQETSDQHCGTWPQRREKRSPVENTSAIPDVRS